MTDDAIDKSEYFYLSTGDTIRDIAELEQKVKTMPDDIFSYHVNSDKNDFASWVRYSLANKALADKLEFAMDKDSFLSTLSKNSESLSKNSESKDYVSDDYFGDGNYSSGVVLNELLKDKNKDSIPSAPPSAPFSNFSDFNSADKNKGLNDELDKAKEKKEELGIEKYKGSVVAKASKKNSKETPQKIKSKGKTSISKSLKKSEKKSEKSKKSRSHSKETNPDEKKSDVYGRGADNFGSDIVKNSKSASNYDENFDYSLDFDDQKNSLAKIRERIDSMDFQLKKTHSSIGKMSGGFSSFDEKYPELSYKDIEKKDFKKGRKPAYHHVHNAAKNAVHHVRRHVKGVSTKFNEQREESRRQKEISNYLNSSKGNASSDKKQMNSKKKYNSASKNSSGSKESKQDFKVFDTSNDSGIHYDMEGLYGKPVREGKVKTPFFKNLMNKFSRTERVVAKELPNLHDVEHAKKGQEVLFSPFQNIEHSMNYHLHGFPDFLRGLLIGMVIGMLFLVIF